MNVRDRVKELRRMRAGDLCPDPRNWRTHPKAQADALRGLLAEIGYAGALLARDLPDGRTMLIDGHLRAETTPDAVVPVLVLDVTEAEAAKILATHDPLGAMAGADADKLDALLRDVQTGSEAVAALLDELAQDVGIVPGDGAEPPEDFAAYGEDIGTEHQCPKCGYKWSGKAGGDGADSGRDVSGDSVD